MHPSCRKLSKQGKEVPAPFLNFEKDSLLLSSPCIMCVQYRGGVQYHGGYHEYHGGYLEYRGGVQYHGGYHEYRGGYLEYGGDIMMHVGDIMSTVEGVQYRGGNFFVI